MRRCLIILSVLGGCGSGLTAPSPPPPEAPRILAVLAAMERRGRADPALLRRFLLDPAPLVRRRALVAVVRLRARALVPTLGPRLRDGHPAVRAAALWAVGQLRAENWWGEVVQALAAREPGVRRAAVRALGRLGLAQGRALVAGALTDPEPTVAAAAADAAARLGGAAVVNPLARALRDRHRTVRFHAAQALARLSRPRRTPLGGVLPVAPAVKQALAEARPALRRAAADPDPWVAASALEALGGQAPLALLRQALARPHLAPALAGVRALAEHAASAAWELLCRAGADPRPHVRLAALRALTRRLRARPPPPAVVASLRAFWRERWRTEAEPFLRGSLLAVGAAVDPAGVEPVLARAAQAGDFRLRLGAARAAGALPSARGLPLLLQLARDSVLAVRAAALRKLAAFFPSPEVTAVLARAAGGPTASEAASVAEGLAQAGDPKAVPLLIRGLRRAGRRGSTAEGRLALLRAVARLGGKRYADFLGEWLADPSPLVRHGVEELLAALGGLPAGEGGGGKPPGPALPAAPVAGRLRLQLVTERGTVTLELVPAWAPRHVATFLALVRRRFYDGKTFHRVVPGHVVQGGDPEGTGYGGLDWTLPDEPADVSFARGVLGLAKLGPDTASSQFFITLLPRPHLDGDYTAFGRVVAGGEVLERLLPHDRILRVRPASPDRS